MNKKFQADEKNLRHDEKNLRHDEKNLRHDEKNLRHDEKNLRESKEKVLAFDLRNVIEETQRVLEMLRLLYPDFTPLTSLQRRRLIGSSVRNYGFMDKAHDLAKDNPALTPKDFDATSLSENMDLVEDLRQLEALFEMGRKMSDDLQLIESDRVFKACLWFYSNLKTAVGAGISGAKEIFDMLSVFFKSRGKRMSIEPTQKQVKRDVNSLLHGKKDGEVIVKNVKPQIVGGEHKVIDESFANKGEFRKTESGEF